MIVVTFIDIKHRQNELVFVLDQLLKKLNVIWVPEVIACKHIDLIHQVLLALRKGTLWPFEIGS